MIRRRSTGTSSVPLTVPELRALGRQGEAKRTVQSKKRKGHYGVRKMYPPTKLGMPARVPKPSVKKVSYESDTEQWIPATLYKFPTARPLTTQEQLQFERNFQRLSPMKAYRLPDITKQMGRLNFD